MMMLASVVLSCGKSEPDEPLKHLQPTSPMMLSPGNATGQDEDPSILVARDGTLFAAWYSNRLGSHPSGRERKELFVVRSTDGVTWNDPPAQATDSSEWSFYPSLAQDGAGGFHLTWMRWHLVPEGCVPAPAPCGGPAPACCAGLDKRVMYNASRDGLGWSEANAVELAAGPADELATIVAASDGRLLVYYVSGWRSGDTDKQIYRRRASTGARGWRAPIRRRR